MVRRKSGSGKKFNNFNFRSFLFFFLLGFLVVSVFVFALKLYAVRSVLDVQEIGFTLNVSDYVGLNIDTDKLHFGSVFPGGSSSRSVFLNSGVDGYVFVSSDFDWLFVEEQGFRVNKGDGFYINLKAIVPLDAEFEDFEGVVYFYVLRSDSRLPFLFLDGEVLGDFEAGKVGASKISINIVD